jgi:hypothetical protein
MFDPCYGKSLLGAGECLAGNLHFTIRENLMNALTRKFRVASTTGVVMSLAMAGVLAMAPMSNAMAKSKKSKIHTITGVSTSSADYGGAWEDWSKKADKTCGFLNYKILYSATNYQKKKVRPGLYIYVATIQCT